MNNPIYFADNKFITHFITHLWYDKWVIKQVITCKRRRKIWIGFNRLLKNFVHMILNGNGSNLKKTGFKADELGKYISALSNSAAIAGKKYGYFVWGIHDESHKIVGTDFDCNRDVNHEPLKHYLARQFSPDINFTFEETTLGGKKVVLLIIPAAKSVPTSYAKERYIRIGSSKENLRKYPEKESFLFDVLRHGFPTMENTPSDYQDLTFEKLLFIMVQNGLKLNPGYL